MTVISYLTDPKVDSLVRTPFTVEKA